MVDKFGYAIALLYAAAGLSVAIVIASISEARLEGVPFAIVMFIMAALAWRAVKKGYATFVILSPLILSAFVIWRVWF